MKILSFKENNSVRRECLKLMKNVNLNKKKKKCFCYPTNQLNPMRYCAKRVSEKKKKTKKGNNTLYYCDLMKIKDKTLEITAEY